LLVKGRVPCSGGRCDAVARQPARGVRVPEGPAPGQELPVPTGVHQRTPPLVQVACSTGSTGPPSGPRRWLSKAGGLLAHRTHHSARTRPTPTQDIIKDEIAVAYGRRSITKVREVGTARMHVTRASARASMHAQVAFQGVQATSALLPVSAFANARTHTSQCARAHVRTHTHMHAQAALRYTALFYRWLKHCSTTNSPRSS